jgi:hypothetical protein
VGVTAQLPTREEIRERVLLLKRFLGQLEWEWPNDVKTKVLEYLGLTENHRISLERLAECLTDAQLERLIRISPVKDYYISEAIIIPLRKEASSNSAAPGMRSGRPSGKY